MKSQAHHSDSNSFLLSAVKLLIMVASLGIASVVGFYLHPHLLPILTESIPQLWGVAQGWFTAPILFLLLNMVVGTLYFSSGMISRPEELPHAQTPTVIPPPMVEKNHGDSSAPESSAPVAASSSRSTTGLRARIEKSRPFTRLVRSKSEQIPPLSWTAEASGARLKKAGTFEAAAQGTRTPLVVVADLPEDEGGAPPPGHEEVDKKAE
eukprot:c18047_g2_i1 orf=112-738(+)